MNPIGLLILIFLVLVISFGSREWVALGMVAGVLYLTEGQQIDLAGFNFFAIRFLELAGFIRIVLKGELPRVRINSIDKSFLVFQSVYLLMFLIGFSVHPGAIVMPTYMIGFFCDGLISYFIFRALLTDPPVFRNFLKKSAYLIIPFTALMMIESITGHNLFSFMGGVPAVPVIRNGHYRAQGSFRVAITAGSFGATLFPLFVGEALAYGRRFWNLTGAVACVMITIAAHSGGPVMALAAGFIAWFCWRIRGHMRMVRWGMFISFVALALVMKAPVWFVIDRVSGIVGGHGWDRANLINQFVNHFSNWWLTGMTLENTANWAATRLTFGSTDVVDTYVYIGLTGGLISLVLFIRFLVECFRSLGSSMRFVRTPEGDHTHELLLWGIGCCLFSNVVNLIGVTYFDQMYVIWYMTLAVVSSLTAYYLGESRAKDQEEAYDPEGGLYDVS
ncbi:MAG: hypothetical protein M0Z61_02250 [Nitrospiraceae bacterium]|nr:hypothetical protein [Nitrospiraceae bacterium]